MEKVETGLPIQVNSSLGSLQWSFLEDYLRAFSVFVNEFIALCLRGAGGRSQMCMLVSVMVVFPSRFHTSTISQNDGLLLSVVCFRRPPHNSAPATVPA